MNDLGWAVAIVATLVAVLLAMGKTFETRRLEKPISFIQWETSNVLQGCNHPGVE